MSVTSPALAPGLASSRRAPGGSVTAARVRRELRESVDGRRHNVLFPLFPVGWAVASAVALFLLLNAARSCVLWVGFCVRVRERGLACGFPRDLDLLQALGCAASNENREVSLTFILGKRLCDPCGFFHGRCRSLAKPLQLEFSLWET